jgi:hypothetical protein
MCNRVLDQYYPKVLSLKYLHVQATRVRISVSERMAAMAEEQEREVTIVGLHPQVTHCYVGLIGS